MFLVTPKTKHSFEKLEVSLPTAGSLKGPSCPERKAERQHVHFLSPLLLKLVWVGGWRSGTGLLTKRWSALGEKQVHPVCGTERQAHQDRPRRAIDIFLDSFWGTDIY
jgi:hypothetical protein